MNRFLLSIFCVLFFTITNQAQYNFETVNDLSCTSIKSQDRTGTCWSFTTVSYLESELLRMGKSAEDLSEMFIVRTIYKDKGRNYFLRQGKANFSEGSLSHDVIRAFEMGGIVPESAFSGLKEGQNRHNHGKMEKELSEFLKEKMKARIPFSEWMPDFEKILDSHLGEAPEYFSIDDANHSPQSYAKSLGINPDDYVTLTSFNHHPFYDDFILEIPDNYSNGTYYNLPLAELMEVAEAALEKGHTIAWDGDVSEATFSSGKGLAVLPNDKESKWANGPVEELKVNQNNRQAAFENYKTTDDHLMHIVGQVKDQDGNQYFKVKNSWGEVGPYSGFLYMSDAYFSMKTVGIMVHKQAIPKAIRKKLNL